MTTPSKPDLVALAPCPFCGGEAEHQPEIGVRSPGYWIRCTKCKVQSDDRNSPEGAAAKWNTRHLASQPSSYEAGLRDMRERAALVASGFDAACNSKRMQPFVEAGLVATVCQRDHDIAAAIAALPADCGEEDRPSLSELHHRALEAAQAFEDAASYEETMWTGWGDCVVPPYAEMRRVKAQQAVSALRDAQKSGAES